MTPETAAALLVPTLTAIMGAFGWLAKQVSDLKKEVKAANILHMECERARFKDGLNIQKLQFEMSTLKRTIEAAGLTKSESELQTSEAAKETVLLSDEEIAKLKQRPTPRP